MCQFMLFEGSLRNFTGIAQSVEIVIGNPSHRSCQCDPVFESQVCVEVPQSSAFDTGGHKWTILLSNAEGNTANAGGRYPGPHANVIACHDSSHAIDPMSWVVSPLFSGKPPNANSA
jgi:hypothetical protein